MKDLKNAILISFTMFILCGLIYPLATTVLAQIMFPHQANGSLIVLNNQAVGSEIVGQDFTDDRFMKCRPSAVNYNVYTHEYNGIASGSDNYGASNPALAKRVSKDMEKFLAKNPKIKKEDIPTDLLTASGSGLDPHISPAAAYVQIPAIAKHTGLSKEMLSLIVKYNTEHKFLGIFGEEGVNVLKVNLEILAHCS